MPPQQKIAVQKMKTSSYDLSYSAIIVAKLSYMQVSSFKSFIVRCTEQQQSQTGHWNS